MKHRLFAFAAGLLTCIAAHAQGSSIEAEVIASGLKAPTAMVFLPDGLLALHGVTGSRLD